MIFGPTFVSYRRYLPQGQTPNELPKYLKYFLFGQISPEGFALKAAT